MQFIKIVNFEKYNPRKDRAKHSWVRVDNTIAWSEDLDGLDADQKWFWVFLLSSASRKQQDSVELNYAYFEKHSGVSQKKMKAAVDHFEKRKMIQVVPRSVSDGNQLVTTGDQSGTNGITTNVTNEHNEQYVRNDTAPEVVPDPVDLFVEFWNKLPFEEMPKVQSVSDKRRKKILARLKEAELSVWFEAMLAIGESDFLLGKKGDWNADIDWLIANEENRAKILEGKYKNKPKLQAISGSKAQDTINRLKSQAERIAAGDL